MAEDKLLEPEHIGDGLYMKDGGWQIAIAVNHHTNDVAFIDMNHVDAAIKYLTRFQERVKKS